MGAEIIGNFHDRRRLVGVFLNCRVHPDKWFIATKVNVGSSHIGGFLAGLLLATFHFKFHWFIRENFCAFNGPVSQYVAILLRIGPKFTIEFFNRS
jgi:hypothetical protein